ncbi:ALP1-like protein isoform X1 [Tanacetum coccineum]
MGLDLVKCYLCTSFIEGHIAKGVGLRVADSHTGSYREDDFMPLETIRRFLSVIGSRSLSDSKGRLSSRIESPPFIFFKIAASLRGRGTLAFWAGAKPTADRFLAPWTSWLAPSCLAPWPPASAKDDAERYTRTYEAYEEFLAMTNQEAGGSGSGIKRTRTYIPRDREEAEQRLLEDYFGNDDTPPKYPEDNFRRMYRMSSALFAKIVNDITSYDAQSLPEYFCFFRQRIDALGRNSIGPILKITSVIRQIAYGTTPDAFDEYLQIVERSNNDLNVLYGSPLFDDVLADTALEAPFVVNGRTYKQGYYLADGIYPTWSTFVKTFSIARDEKTLKFKRVQESARKDIERAFGVLQCWGIIRQPARALQINTLKRIMYCIILHNMILQSEKFELSNFKDMFVNPEPNMQRTWIERCDLHVRRSKELRDSKVHKELRHDLVNHL